MSEQRQSEPTEEEREGREQMEKLEQADEVPSDPHEWPGGKAKYLTFGGSEDDSNEPYGEDVTGKLGPASVAHHPDGSVTVEGEKVEDPDQFKGEPIPGGPTDPDAPDLAGEKRSPSGGEGDAA
jgi:hypothetical protein